MSVCAETGLVDGLHEDAAGETGVLVGAGTYLLLGFLFEIFHAWTYYLLRS